jgi:hypothetical protein
MESDQECGEKWHGSFAKYDPRYVICGKLTNAHFSRTWTEFLETWPQMGFDAKWGVLGGQTNLAHQHSRRQNLDCRIRPTTKNRPDFGNF